MGETHDVRIPNSYYIPMTGIHLLSPQLWAQNQQGKDRYDGAGTVTTATTCTMFWNGSQSKRTIPINIKGNNIATLQLHTGYSKFYNYFLAIKSNDYEEDPLTQMEVDASLISDSEEEQESNTPQHFEPQPPLTITHDEEWSPPTVNIDIGQANNIRHQWSKTDKSGNTTYHRG